MSIAYLSIFYFCFIIFNFMTVGQCSIFKKEPGQELNDIDIDEMDPLEKVESYVDTHGGMK